jgi:hypothetical protein
MCVDEARLRTYAIERPYSRPFALEFTRLAAHSCSASKAPPLPKPRTAGVVIASATLCVTLLSCSRPCRDCAVLSDREFAALVESLSEDAKPFRPSNGYESDNWVSNERSFQDVLPGLPRLENRAYIGVGPEQNFTYLSYLEPKIAFIVDVRRENLALHLFYKALFELSDDRAGFMSHLFCREPIQHPSTADGVNELLGRIQAAAPSNGVAAATRAAVFDRLVRYHGLRLPDTDRAAMDTAYGKFCEEGPAIRWTADDRPWIPTYGELMKGRDGQSYGFLASELQFQTVKWLQQRNAIVPVVGDFGGTKALAGIAAFLKRHDLTVAVFYVSNVRPYLRGEALNRFEANVADLPADAASVMIETSFHAAESRSSKPDFATSTYTVPMRHR